MSCFFLYFSHQFATQLITEINTSQAAKLKFYILLFIFIITLFFSKSYRTWLAIIFLALLYVLIVNIDFLRGVESKIFRLNSLIDLLIAMLSLYLVDKNNLINSVTVNRWLFFLFTIKTFLKIKIFNEITNRNFFNAIV